jgi:hypothetical protein
LLTRKTSSRNPSIPDKPFGGAVGVHLGGVDQSQSYIDAEAQRSNLLLPPERILCHVPRPLTERGNGFAGAKIDGAGRCGEHGHDKLLLRTLPGPRADCVRLRHQTIRVSHGCEPTALTVINAVFIQCKA